MAHIHEKIDFTVEVYIVHKNKVLLRFHGKYKFWLSVGGHIELNEDPIQAAIREVKEEVGLDIKIHNDLLITGISDVEVDRTELIPPKFMNRHRISETHEHVSLIYFATSETDQVKVEGEADDISNDWKWLTAPELEEMDLRPYVKEYARQALKELSV